jgi:beta-glucanase (GH16 family)
VTTKFPLIRSIRTCLRLFAGRKLLVTLLAFLTINYAVLGQKTSELVFSDEFTGTRGAAPDVDKWTLEVGGGGWGNKELECYRNSNEDAFLDGSGDLVIQASRSETHQELRCWYGPCKYTSARLITKGKFDQLYGRFEARIKIPVGRGVWPAFWLLGSNIDQVGWPQCGEIDVMENIGREPSVVHGTVHGPGYSGANGIGSPFNLSKGAFADDFHVYSIDWSPDQIRWRVDGTQYKSLSPHDLPIGSKWVFDHPFFIILNFAVGGAWPGDPDATTIFPQKMMIDYVRVYANKS